MTDRVEYVVDDPAYEAAQLAAWEPKDDYATHPIIDTSKLAEVETEQNVDFYEYATMEYLSHVPNSVLDAMVDKGWTIQILAADQDDHLGFDDNTGGHTYGYTVHQDHRIVLESDTLY